MPWAYPAPAAKKRPLVNSYDRGGYSAARKGKHWGIDIAAPEGSPAKAVKAGKIVGRGNVWGDAYGKQVLLRWRTKTGKRRFAFYAHLHTIDVKEGQRVKKGQTIGEVGSTGNSTGPHIHFEYGSSPHWDMKRFNPYKQLERARKALL